MKGRIGDYQTLIQPPRRGRSARWRSPHQPHIAAASGAGRQVRQGGFRPQERSPDYRVVAAWVAFMLFLGAGAFAVGMAIHNETLANRRVPQARESSIYYCATGDEMPLFEPCKEMKAQRDI